MKRENLNTMFAAINEEMAKKAPHGPAIAPHALGILFAYVDATMRIADALEAQNKLTTQMLEVHRVGQDA